MQTRAKFALALSLHSEDPQQPLTFSCRPWEGAPAESVATMLDADVLQRMVSDACAPHACGFGRLGAIVGAVDRGLHPLTLILSRTLTLTLALSLTLALALALALALTLTLT